VLEVAPGFGGTSGGGAPAGACGDVNTAVIDDATNTEQASAMTNLALRTEPEHERRSENSEE